MELSVGVIKTFICLYSYMFKSTKKWLCWRLLGYISYRSHSYWRSWISSSTWPVAYFHNLPWIAFVKNAKRAGVFPSLSHESRGGLSTLYSRMISLFLSSRGLKFLGAVETCSSCISFGNLDLEFSREIRSPHSITAQNAWTVRKQWITIKCYRLSILLNQTDLYVCT